MCGSVGLWAEGDVVETTLSPRGLGFFFLFPLLLLSLQSQESLSFPFFLSSFLSSSSFSCSSFFVCACVEENGQEEVH